MFNRLFPRYFYTTILTSLTCLNIAMAGPVSTSKLNERLKEVQASDYASRIATTSEFDAWLSKSKTGDPSDTDCITSYARVKTGSAENLAARELADKNYRAAVLAFSEDAKKRQNAAQFKAILAEAKKDPIVARTLNVSKEMWGSEPNKWEDHFKISFLHRVKRDKEDLLRQNASIDLGLARIKTAASAGDITAQLGLRLLEQHYKLELGEDRSKWSDLQRQGVLSLVARYQPPEDKAKIHWASAEQERIEREKYLALLKEFTNEVQNEILRLNGGKKDSEWSRYQSEYERAYRTYEERNLRADRSITEEERNARWVELENKYREKSEKRLQERIKYSNEQRRISDNLHQSTPFAVIYLLHRNIPWDKEMPTLAGHLLEEIKNNVLDAYGDRCPNVNIVELGQNFSDFIGASTHRSVFVKRADGWNNEEIDSQDIRGGIIVVPENSSKAGNYWNWMGESFWDRREYHPEYSQYETSLMLGNNELITVPKDTIAPTSEDIRLAMLREYKHNTNAKVDFRHSSLTGDYFGGSYTSYIMNVSNVNCNRLAEHWKCSYNVETNTVFEAKAGTALLQLMVEAKTGEKNYHVSKKEIGRFVLTANGWRAPDRVESIKEARRRMLKSVGDGLKTGGCSATLMGPEELVPPECD